VSRIAQIFRPQRSLMRRRLAMLDDRYPNGLEWLDRRLDDIEAGRAGLWQIGNQRRALGWAITTPKGRHEVKLSTYYIAPPARGFGLGCKLLDFLVADWARRDILTARVTVDEGDLATRRFFEKYGFALRSDGRRAYGERFDSAYELALDEAAIHWPSFPTSGVSQVSSRFIASRAS
jgi:L-amino acid N-acyltransferase YncA